MYEVRKGEGEPGWGLAYSYRKASSEPPGLTPASHGRVAINSTNAFSKFSLWRNLVFIYETEITD